MTIYQWMQFAKRGSSANSRPTNRLLVALTQPAYRPLLRKHLRPVLLDLLCEDAA